MAGCTDVPQVGCRAPGDVSKARRQHQHHRPLYLAFKQEAPLVDTRKKAQASLIPQAVIALQLHQGPERPRLQGQDGPLCQQAVQPGLGVCNHAAGCFERLQQMPLQDQPALEPLQQGQRRPHVGKQEHHRKAVGLPFQMPQQPDGHRLRDAVRDEVWGLLAHARPPRRATAGARRTNHCRCGSSTPGGCQESAPARAACRRLAGRCHGWP